MSNGRSLTHDYNNIIMNWINELWIDYESSYDYELWIDWDWNMTCNWINELYTHI